MLTNSFFSDWLESFLVDDDRFGDAYDAVPDNRRAWLKTTIARLHALYGTPQVTWGRQENHWRQGHVSITESRPVDWTMVVVDSTYASGVRMLGAAMMPLLSGVDDILVVFTGDGEIAPETLASLELAGLELAVQLDEQKTAALVKEVYTVPTSGRILALGKSSKTIVHGSGIPANGIQVWYEPHYTGMGILEATSVDKELLVWAHPDLALSDVSQDAVSEQVSLAALCCEADSVDSIPDTVPVSLGAGQEGCWIWPDLHPQWFTHCRFSLLSEV